MNVSWNYIASRGEHIIANGAYEILYGAPDPAVDMAGYLNWLDDVQPLPPTPKEFHVEDCPGCWFEQWRE